MAQATFNTTEKVEFHVAPADANGATREVENFDVDVQGADLTFDYDPETGIGHIISGDTTGTFPVIFKADARIGDGEVLLTETHEVVITAVEATTLTATFGAVTPK